jgi:hypothetical protein
VVEGAQDSTRRKSLDDVQTCPLAISCEENLPQRQRSLESGAPSTTVRSLRELQWSPSPANAGADGASGLALTTRSASELDQWRGANATNLLRYPPLATCFFLPSAKRGGRTPTDAGHQPPRLRTARAQRARTPVGVPPRLLPKGVFVPKAQLQARLPRTRSARALPAFACPSPGMHLPPRS